MRLLLWKTQKIGEKDKPPEQLNHLHSRCSQNCCIEMSQGLIEIKKPVDPNLDKAKLLSRIQEKLRAKSKKLSFKSQLSGHTLQAAGRLKESFSVKYQLTLQFTGNELCLAYSLKSGGILILFSITYGLVTLLTFAILGPFGFIFLLLFLFPFMIMLFKTAASRRDVHQYFEDALIE